MTRFDRFLVVDWSASSTAQRGKDSIWIGGAYHSGAVTHLSGPINPSTRREAEAQIRKLLVGSAREGERVLVGFDFSYGYPSGFADAAGLEGRPLWRAVWDHLEAEIEDAPRNRNNRFEVASQLNQRIGGSHGPFWGCPARQTTPFLKAKRKGSWDFPYAAKLGNHLERLRMTEARMKGVQETWKLFGAGSVGSQALMGIPCVARLRNDPGLRSISRVWPFETGFSASSFPEAGPFVLHAEVWPSAVAIQEQLHPIRDAAQVLSLSHCFAELDRHGRLEEQFAEPPGLSEKEIQRCTQEEGWILGCA